MKKQLKLLVIALAASPAIMAQEIDSLAVDVQGEEAYTFTESQ